MSTTRINVKITHQSNLRRIVLEERNNAWNVLVERIHLVFNLNETSTFKVQYIDEEGDTISISSDQELCEAMDQFQGKPSVRLNLVIDNTPITPSASVQEKSICEPSVTEQSTQSDTTSDSSTDSTSDSDSTSTSDSSTTSDSSSDDSTSSDSEERIEQCGRGSGRHAKRGHWKKRHGKKFAKRHSHGKKHWKKFAKHHGGHGKKHWKKHCGGDGKKFAKHQDEQVENFMKKRQQKRGSFGRDLSALEAKGFSEKRVNIMLLRRFDDDETRVDKVITLLLKNAQLVEKGYTKRGMNLRLLLRFDGDLDKVMEKLDYKKAKWEKRQEWKEALKQLEAKGYRKKGLNRMLLRKNDGDVAAVEALLVKSSILEERGFYKTHLNIRLLQKFDGNVDDVEEFLITKNKKRARKHYKRHFKHHSKRRK